MLYTNYTLGVNLQCLLLNDRQSNTQVLTYPDSSHVLDFLYIVRAFLNWPFKSTFLKSWSMNGIR